MRYWRRSIMSGLRKPGGIFRIPALLALVGMSFSASAPAQAQQGSAVPFQNVRILDGKNGALSTPSNVLLRDNTLEPNSVAAMTAYTKQIIGGESVLSARLIDEHTAATVVSS